MGGTLSAVRGKLASIEGVLCSFVPDTVAGHNVNLLFSSLAPSGGGSRPAAGTPSAPPVEALVWHCAVAARTPPQACLQRRQWRLLSAMFSREHMTIQTGVLNVCKCFFFVETRTSVQRPAPFSNVFVCQSRSKTGALCFCLSYFKDRSASHTSTAVGNDSIHIVSKWGLEMRELEIQDYHSSTS